MRQFYGHLEKCVLSAGKTMSVKFAFFGGGFGGGGGSADFIFMGARIFLNRVSHQIPADSEMSRQNRATPPPNQGVAPFSGPPCRTFLSFAAGRGRGGLVEGSAALLGSENGSRYRAVSQLQSHQSRYSVQLSR